MSSIAEKSLMGIYYVVQHENSPVTGEFPSQGPVTRSFDGFFDLNG